MTRGNVTFVTLIFVSFFSGVDLMSTASLHAPLFSIQFVSSAPDLAALPRAQHQEVAIVGRSNVGKSSLLNFLAGARQLARTSRTPGRTQLMNVFAVTPTRTAPPEAVSFGLVDLPGYGFALSPREVQSGWADAMQSFFEQRKPLCAVLFLMDIRRDIGPEDLGLLRWFMKLGLQVILVVTKADKFNRSQRQQRLHMLAAAAGLDPAFAVLTSIREGLGRRQLEQQLLQILGGQGGAR